MSSTTLQYDLAKEQVFGFLIHYLESRGIHVTPGKNFKCINPAHDDSDPSCGIVPNTDNKVFHCFGCGSVGNIFTAANMLEDKPLAGVGFLHDNFKYLADTFGVEMPLDKPTPEEQHEMDMYRAYRDAAQIILFSKYGDRVLSKLNEYTWSDHIRLSLGVGSVTSYEDFITRMKKQHGWSDSFMKEIDLHRKSMFNEDNLIFIIRDEDGNPVGFACRNLKYEDDLEEYTKQKKAIEGQGLTTEQVKTKLDDLKHPTKYINSMEQGGETGLRNWIYQKSKRLYGLHRARKYSAPLYILEGYSDCVTAVNAGINNAVAIGSTSFTKEHLDLILNLDIKHLVFVLDADDAGETGTDRFVKLLEEHVGGHIGLRVELISMPEGTDDPDAYIRHYGVKSFKELPRTDIFGWSLKKAMKCGEDPRTLAERMVPLIVNDQNNFVRLHKVDQLAVATGMPKDVIWREVTRLVDSEQNQLIEEQNLIAGQAAKQLQNHPDRISTILQESLAKVEQISSRKNGYSVSNTKTYIDEIRRTMESSLVKVELKTGWELFDAQVGGIPKSEAFVTIPGKMNQGKSSFLANLAWRLLEFNTNTMVLYHTIDDSMSTFLPRLWASKYELLKFDPILHGNGGRRLGWESNDFKHVGYHMHNTPGFEEVYRESQKWMDKMIENELLVPDDISTLPGSLTALGGRIKALRQKFPDRNLIVMGDNFHLYDLPGYKEGEEKVRHKSMYAKELANRYHCTILMTMELPKFALAAGVRPRVRSIKGSSGMSYDSSLNIGVYNDLKDFGPHATIVNKINGAIDPATEEAEYRQPIIELVFDKSKINSFDGVLYYALEPRSGHMRELPKDDDEVSQATMRNIALTTQDKKQKKMASESHNQ